MKIVNSANYWQERYQTAQTQWDLGAVSPALKQWFSEETTKNSRILIPGAGNGHEVEYLWRAGFKQVYLCDWAEQALINFKKRCPDFPDEQLICSDFFELEGTWDLIIEQTFFCALLPELRVDYAKKMKDLLAPNGRLVGLFFNQEFGKDGPPFGGEKEQYESLFKPYFSSTSFEPCIDSIPARSGRELFAVLSR